MRNEKFIPFHQKNIVSHRAAENTEKNINYLPLIHVFSVCSGSSSEAGERIYSIFLSMRHGPAPFEWNNV